jgi:tetratricopeptide (TPR) repeat protein
MERKTYITFAIISLLILSSLTSVKGQNRDELFFKCYTTTNMEPWKKTMEQMAATRKAENYDQLFEVVLAWYGYIGYCLGNDKEDEAEKYLETGWDYLDELTEMPEAGAAPHALKSGFYGFEMALARYKALILGPKSVSALKTAAAIDSTNIHYLVEKGNQMYYMPSMLGGDKDVALHHYQQAVNLMEAGNKYHEKHWFYLNTLITLGITYQSVEQIEQAREVYHKIQRIAPRFKWFNEDIWPKFAEKYGA